MVDDGARLHLNHGPIDLIISCDGAPSARAVAYRAATDRFDGLLDELVAELPLLRTPVTARGSGPDGIVARRMFEAVAPYGGECGVVTPMAAVAGAVADEIGAAMAGSADVDRWMVNNGGDIAFGLAPGQHYRAGLVVDPRRATVDTTVAIDADSGIGGIATSGRHGRSFSLGVADAVTVLAASAAAADAAATLIANRVDVGPHRAVVRRPASSLDPDSDLGARPVTVDVGPLTLAEIQAALGQGLEYAAACVSRGLIDAAVLHLAGQTAATSTKLLASGIPA